MRHSRTRVWRTRLAVVLALGGVAGLSAVVVVAAPPWFVHDRSLEGLRAQNEVRTTLLQGLGGVALLVGAYFTYRQVAHSREQLQMAQRGQITERFTRAIDQLGHPQLDVRLGGMYALERIAHDSRDDRATIREVLTAFVRSHAPWPPKLSGQYVATAPIGEIPELQVRAPDVQASLSILGRGGFALSQAPSTRREGTVLVVRHAQGDPIDLYAVDLRRARLPDVHLEGANLTGAHLEGADLHGAHLEGANLADAHLEGANLEFAHLEEALLYGAHLKGANLTGVHLENAGLTGASLEGATLSIADLKGAILSSARLERANLLDAHLEAAGLMGAYLEGAALHGAYLQGAALHGAHLEGAALHGAHLQGAVADDSTGWPDAFDWRAAGVMVTGEDASSPS
jgi:uncharacterized protein YjbI with pentapeptide repeats